MEKPVEIVLRGGQFKQYSDQELAAVKKKYDLKRMETDILYVLSIDDEDDTVIGLHAYLNVNKGHVSQTMYQLSLRGLVTAEQDRKDRRYTHYHLTEEGCRVAREIGEVWGRIRNDLFEGIPEEEVATFASVVRKISRNLDARLA